MNSPYQYQFASPPSQPAYPWKINQIAAKIIGAAINVHRKLGPGLLESAYEACLEYELHELGYTSSGRSQCRSGTAT